jgi:hypothetical protein
MPRTRKAVAVLCTVVTSLSGCAQKVPKEALELTPESLKLRQLQTRRFESKDEKALLAACAAVLQDLEFTLDQSETALGIIVASKDRSAVEAGQVIGSIFVALLIGVPVPWDEKQKIRASLVTRPAGPDGNNTLVRVTFQRMVWNTQGHVTKSEPLDEPRFYQEFFEKLSKAVFLHAHEL